MMDIFFGFTRTTWNTQRDYEFCNGARFTFHVAKRRDMYQSTSFCLSNKLLSASRCLPSPLALEGLVGYLGYGGECMGTFETHGRLHQPFPFSAHFHGVCHFLGRQKAFALLQHTPYSAIAI